jgi:hypothetical protein
MPEIITTPYRFIENRAGVHLEFDTSPFWTLRGFQFAEDGSADEPPGRIRFGKHQAPFHETGKRVVTCPRASRSSASARPSRSRICRRSRSSRNDPAPDAERPA